MKNNHYFRDVLNRNRLAFERIYFIINIDAKVVCIKSVYIIALFFNERGV